MKVVILNQKVFQDLFDGRDPHNMDHSQIHKELFNLVRNNYHTNNIIEVVSFIDYRGEGSDACAIFQFEGKNKDIFFYTFTGTAA